MTLIEKLRAAIRPHTITDPTFGRLLWFAGKPPRTGYWEGKTAIEINAHDVTIEVLLDGNKAGVSESQRAFFLDLSHRIPGLLEVIVERARTRPELSEISVGGLRTRWVALSSDPLRMEWELGFDIEGARNMHVIAAFLGWQVARIAVED